MKCDKNKSGNGKQSGLTAFIVNRMSVVIFNDLVHFDINKDNQECNIHFPKLIPMCQFLYNFAIYCHCYPFDRVNESFYLSQYFDLRHQIYYSSNVSQELKHFNYFNYYSDNFGCDGTLLHATCYREHNQYSEILIGDDFNCRQYNMQRDFYKKTPLMLVSPGSQKSNTYLLTLMQVTSTIHNPFCFFVLLE